MLCVLKLLHLNLSSRSMTLALSQAISSVCASWMSTIVLNDVVKTTLLSSTWFILSFRPCTSATYLHKRQRDNNISLGMVSETHGWFIVGKETIRSTCFGTKGAWLGEPLISMCEFALFPGCKSLQGLYLAGLLVVGEDEAELATS